jgi:AraC-like DNA-binding protein
MVKICPRSASRLDSALHIAPSTQKQSRKIAPFRRVQPALALAAAHLDENLPLAVLSATAGLSPFHLRRMFSRVAGETPKQFTLCLSLSQGAAMLLATDDSVLMSRCPAAS